ncbi:MAG: hypothetical protein J6D61_04280 [Clostridia bacterium]|nr:hypothetical protein [Clostridia bacterium]MBP3588615.1 hypothetical protein [Clostridia bacterium]
MKKVGIGIPILWGIASLLGCALVIRQFHRAAINGNWYGSEDTTVIWVLYTLMSLVNTVLWAIRYKNGKQQAETVDKPEE